MNNTGFYSLLPFSKICSAFHYCQCFLSLCPNFSSGLSSKIKTHLPIKDEWENHDKSIQRLESYIVETLDSLV